MIFVRRRVMQGAIVLGLAVCAIACGGGDGGTTASTSGTTVTPPVTVTPVSATTASNVVDVVVDSGPDPSVTSSVNTLFTTVTVCVPGSTTQCQTIDHIQVDTGSYGLRILAPALTLTLPVQPATDGNSLVECTAFVDGYSWGPVAVVDLQVSGETASNLPIQIIGDSRFPTVPKACTEVTKDNAEDTVDDFGANGILGIGVFKQDCGSYCEAPDTGSYYSCTQAGSCTDLGAPLTSQVLNPVPLFPTDNNGTFISLPSVASAGAASLAGTLTFGIDTQSNNVSGSQTILALDDSGYFTTTLNGQTLSSSFIDSGSNALFFDDSSLTACPTTDDPGSSTSANFKGFYCSPSTVTLSAMLQGSGTTGVAGTVGTITFSVDSAQALATANPSYTVFPTLGGPYDGTNMTFDWGLPFFYGRSVANAIEESTTTVGTGPYVAY